MNNHPEPPPTSRQPARSVGVPSLHLDGNNRNGHTATLSPTIRHTPRSPHLLHSTPIHSPLRPRTWRRENSLKMVVRPRLRAEILWSLYLPRDFRVWGRHGAVWACEGGSWVFLKCWEYIECGKWRDCKQGREGEATERYLGTAVFLKLL